MQNSFGRVLKLRRPNFEDVRDPKFLTISCSDHQIGILWGEGPSVTPRGDLMRQYVDQAVAVPHVPSSLQRELQENLKGSRQSADPPAGLSARDLFAPLPSPNGRKNSFFGP